MIYLLYDLLLLAYTAHTVLSSNLTWTGITNLRYWSLTSNSV